LINENSNVYCITFLSKMKRSQKVGDLSNLMITHQIISENPRLLNLRYIVGA